MANPYRHPISTPVPELQGIATIAAPAQPEQRAVVPITREQIADIIAAKVSGPSRITDDTKRLHRLDQLTAADAILAALDAAKASELAPAHPIEREGEAI